MTRTATTACPARSSPGPPRSSTTRCAASSRRTAVASPTIVEVAEALGVSPSTVSRAFNRPAAARDRGPGARGGRRDGLVPNRLARA
ncbi:LacI family transcriptional regulator [Georgenia wutianyii]|uniref:LacI family transcriptional regulator n=1 Tax=Georgenia wutianyii TaxID=2585135 RepID=A0ABX5VRI3_9MICO|nr:LacI family transcriptional regulator [Georgenia wutianyii]